MASEESRSLSEFAGLGGRALARNHGTPDTTETVTLSVASAVNQIDLSGDSHYQVVSDVDSFIKLGTDATVVATTSGFPLFAKQPFYLYIKSPTKRIAAIAAGAGKLYITKMLGT